MLKLPLSLALIAIVLVVMPGCQNQLSTDPVSSETSMQKPGGSALAFDGVDDYVEVPHNSSLNATNELTISAWVYFNSDNNIAQYPVPYASIVTKGTSGISNGPVNNNYALHSSGDGRFALTATTTSGGFQFVSDNSPLSSETWHHVAVTYKFDGTLQEVKFYVDGSLVPIFGPLSLSTGPAELVPNDEALTIGVDFPVDAEYWFGKIDEVKIWNEALSASQIVTAMSAATPVARALMGFWRFNEGAGTNASDRSRNHNDGTLINGPAWSFPGAF